VRHRPPTPRLDVKSLRICAQWLRRATAAGNFDWRTIYSAMVWDWLGWYAQVYGGGDANAVIDIIESMARS
jgi:hypothetical protein